MIEIRGLNEFPNPFLKKKKKFFPYEYLSLIKKKGPMLKSTVKIKNDKSETNVTYPGTNRKHNLLT